MAIHVEKFNIGYFRGIRDLDVSNLNHVNIIVGDNNSGKTSVLESLLLLRNPADFTNVLRIARMRDRNLIFNIPVFDNFINLFPRNIMNMEISISAVCKNEYINYKLHGKQVKVMIEADDIIKEMSYVKRKVLMETISSDIAEANVFSGELIYTIEGIVQRKVIEFNNYTTTTGREIGPSSYLKIVYLSPVDHIGKNIFDRIIRNNSYKDICLYILQLFDSDIEDLLILRDEKSNRPLEYIKHKKLGNMPMSTFGDGIKKVLALANGIAHAAGGVLLIDEVETAIHSKYYNDIFNFLVKACKQFKVQLIITTHSIEAIDGILSTQEYEKQNNKDDINVITFKKDKVKTLSRVLGGREVFLNREHFGFEVRL